VTTAPICSFFIHGVFSILLPFVPLFSIGHTQSESLSPFRDLHPSTCVRHEHLRVSLNAPSTPFFALTSHGPAFIDQCYVRGSEPLFAARIPRSLRVCLALPVIQASHEPVGGHLGSPCGGIIN
jgi:hypothetical protein